MLFFLKSYLPKLVVPVEAADGSQAGAFGEVDGRVGLIALHAAAAEEDCGFATNSHVVPRCAKVRDGTIGT